MRVKRFGEFLSEDYSINESKLEAIKKKIDGEKGARTVIGMYNFYFDNGYKDIKDPEKLIKKLEYYDQKVREDEIIDVLRKAGMSMQTIDKENLKLVKPFISKVKPGTEEFRSVWLIIQHADYNVDAQKKFLEIHKDEMKKKDSSSLTYLEDRIAANEGKPQKGISQGMEVTLKGKTGWVPYQNSDIEFENDEVKAEDDEGKEIILLKWKDGETSKVSAAVDATISDNVKKNAKKAGLVINLKNYVEQILQTDYLGPYMIKR